MTRRQRLAHLVAWATLGPGCIVLVVLAFATRPPAPRPVALPPAGAAPGAAP